MVRRPRPRLPYPRIAPRQNPTASATCADRPKPTFMLVSTGLSPKLIFTAYPEACHDNHADA